MEIERVNENTIKLFISYEDIENRGFTRHEIWSDREKSEQLFWKIMEEVNTKEEFVAEGPLWIQVHGHARGLEVVVTKSQNQRNNQNNGLSLDFNEDEMPINERIESLLERKLGFSKQESLAPENNLRNKDSFALVVRFEEFEDLIQLSHSFDFDEVYNLKESLYFYEDDYYMVIKFVDDTHEEDEQDDFLSRVLEYATESNLSNHMLEEYGKLIFNEDVLNQVTAYFPK